VTTFRSCARAACDEPAASGVAPPPAGVAPPAVVAPRGRLGLVPVVRLGSGALTTRGPSWSGDGVAMAACDKPAASGVALPAGVAPPPTGVAPPAVVAPRGCQM
jgi:hypothetical protein